ncbi:MAG: YggS family pyridoxal phosphate-dependent enzyme [Alphaproteobacteria bacterium]|nr:YggS family pyridoxal phosphate-dependent enzyme [Alphaproteobacteria bacterium]
MTDIADNFARVRRRIADAATEAGRRPEDVALVAVSKTVEAPGLEVALAEGQRIFGENRVQEAEGKWPALKARHPDLQLRLIGPLQTNKAKDAVRLFDVIETVDRSRLVDALARACEQVGRRPRVLIQVNIGREPQKAGADPDDADHLIDATRLAGFVVDGVMCIPPAEGDPAPHFDLLGEIARRNGLAQLSMGMSGDFETAIRHGSTHVRVGSAIFGARG